MLGTVIIKEGKQLLSDKGFLLLALIQPIIFIIMFGSSFQGGDINHLDTVIIDKDNTNFSQYVINATEESEFFDIVPSSGSLEKDLKRLNNSNIRALILIPKGFEENINNVETGKIEIYIDSSNFLTYSSLTGAKIEIAKGVLKEVTNDILYDIEKETEEGKEKIEEIKDKFNEIDNETYKLDIEIKNLKDTNLSEVEDLIADIDDSLKSQQDSISSTEENLDQLILSLNTLQTINATEEQKKLYIANQLSLIKDGLTDSYDRIGNSIYKLSDINLSEYKDINTKNIDYSIDKIKTLFEEAQDIAKTVNFDFHKLERKFLSEPIIIEETAVQGPLKYFDYLGAGVLSLIVFFVGLMAPSLNVISEKEKNTLYRISTTPASSFTIFFGKFLLFIIFGFIEMIYTIILAIFLYGLRITGSFFDVIIILFLLSCCSISLGLFISTKVKTMQQALVIIPLVVIPSFLISHAFFPPDIMAPFMNYVAYITPMTFSNHALNAIMIKGFTLSEVFIDIIALLAFTVIPLILFIWSYKKIRY